MKSTLKSDSRKECKEREEKSIESNQSNQSNRSNNTFHMSRDVALVFRRYAHMHTGSLAVCIENALLEYMQNHPLEDVNLTINHVTEKKLTEIQKRLEIALMYSEIKHLVEVLDRIQRTGLGNYKEFQYDLLKALKPAIKLRTPSPKLIELLKEAEKHIDTI